METEKDFNLKIYVTQHKLNSVLCSSMLQQGGDAH